MPNICVPADLTINGAGALGVGPTAYSREVATASHASWSVAYLYTPTLYAPHTLDLMYEHPGGEPVDLELRLRRPSIRTVVSNPNAIQIRDGWEATVYAADSSSTHRYPEVDLMASYRSQYTSSLDIGAQSSGTPFYGRRSMGVEESLVEYPVTRLYAGDRVYLRWTMAYWTPPPWSDNASNNNASHRIWAGAGSAALVAVPLGGDQT